MAEIYLTNEGEYLRVIERRDTEAVVFNELRGGITVVALEVIDSGRKVDWSQQVVQYTDPPDSQ